MSPRKAGTTAPRTGCQAFVPLEDAEPALEPGALRKCLSHHSSLLFHPRSALLCSPGHQEMLLCKVRKPKLTLSQRFLGPDQHFILTFWSRVVFIVGAITGTCSRVFQRKRIGCVSLRLCPCPRLYLLSIPISAVYLCLCLCLCLHLPYLGYISIYLCRLRQTLGNRRMLF